MTCSVIGDLCVTVATLNKIACERLEVAAANENND